MQSVLVPGIEFYQVEILFNTNTTNYWLQQGSTKLMFGKFWFEGKLCVLFADSKTYFLITNCERPSRINGLKKIAR